MKKREMRDQMYWDAKAIQWREERINALTVALRDLVAKLSEVEDSPQYKSVWTIYQIHMGPDRGPQYGAELKRAREVLIGAEPR